LELYTYTRFDTYTNAGPCGGFDVRHRRMVDASTCRSSASSLELYRYPSGGFIALRPLSQCISRGETLLLSAGESGQNKDAVSQAAVAQALEFPLHWRIRLVLRHRWRRAVAGLVFPPSRTAFTQRRHRRRELARLTGRPKVLDASKVALAQRMHDSGESTSTIAATRVVSRATVYRVLAENAD